MTNQHANVAVVGAGIVGLAHAYLAAKKGRSVVVFERSPKILGASVRGFGLISPISQSPGAAYQMAMASREIWMELLQSARLPYQPTGSLHLAYHDDEFDVIREFADLGPSFGYVCQRLDPRGVASRTQAALTAGLLGALWSPSEVAVDPRWLLRKIPEFLAERYGVKFRFGTAVHSISLPNIDAGSETWSADTAIVCAGDDFETLYPEAFTGSGISRCKLQMMRTAPQPGGWRLGPSLAGGLTLRFSPSFAICSTLPILKERIARELPEYDQWGIQVMVTQTSDGELTMGYSHEDGLAPDVFDKTLIDNLVIRYLRNFLQAPNLDVTDHWHAIHARHPEQPYLVSQPAQNVRVVTALGGNDMTLAFGLARQVLAEMAI